MVYITGDTHGDLTRFQTREVKKLKRGDTLIVCGDFGFLWDGGKEEVKALKWLAKRRYNILFVEGTHDNLHMIDRCPVVDFGGGKANKISENIYRLIRGNLFEIEGRRIFAMGGGESTDMDIRIPETSWWEGEMPTPAEFMQAKAVLEKAGGSVDYVVTHEASRTIRTFLDMEMDVERFTVLNDYFKELEGVLRFGCWYFGAYHIDKKIPPRHRALFKDVVAL